MTRKHRYLWSSVSSEASTGIYTKWGRGGRYLVNRSRGIRTCIMGNIGTEPRQQPHRKHHVMCKIGPLEAIVQKSNNKQTKQNKKLREFCFQVKSFYTRVHHFERQIPDIIFWHIFCI